MDFSYFSLLTNLVNSKMYGLFKSMGYKGYGLRGFRLYVKIALEPEGNKNMSIQGDAMKSR